jgi:hypothetical protein
MALGNPGKVAWGGNLEAWTRPASPARSSFSPTPIFPPQQPHALQPSCILPTLVFPCIADPSRTSTRIAANSDTAHSEHAARSTQNGASLSVPSLVQATQVRPVARLRMASQRSASLRIAWPVAGLHHLLPAGLRSRHADTLHTSRRGQALLSDATLQTSQKARNQVRGNTTNLLSPRLEAVLPGADRTQPTTSVTAQFGVTTTR